MNKSWTSNKQVMNISQVIEQVMKKEWKKSWISCEVMKNSRTSHEQYVNKSWTSHEQVMNKSWTSHEQIVNKLWTWYEHTPWTSVTIKINKITEPFKFSICMGLGGCVVVWDQIKAVSAWLELGLGLSLAKTSKQTKMREVVDMETKYI